MIMNETDLSERSEADVGTDKPNEKPEEEVATLDLNGGGQACKDENSADLGCCHRMVTRFPRCNKVISNNPRCCSILLGVLLPLWIILLVSTIFGMILAAAEGPLEVQQNNARLASQREALSAGRIVADLAARLPKLCFKRYLSNQTNMTDDLLEIDLLEESHSNSMDSDSDMAYVDNATEVVLDHEFYDFMKACGDAARPFLVDLLVEAANLTHNATGALTFNWIRCYPGANGLSALWNVPTWKSIEELQPQNQLKLFAQTWEADFEQIVNSSGADNTVLAKKNASANASGGSVCELNTVSAVWFWFTVMATVGYGNQVPQTTEGRSLVYTLGFLCILLFGIILAAAGFIVSAISDDAANRVRCTWVARPAVGCLIWGALYYAWMVLIAGVSKSWKKHRLYDDPFDFKDGYWFAYISTTSVGFGDIYLEPEVMISKDLFVFPLLFLWGFILLVAFLGKLSEVLSSLTIQGRKTLIGSLVEQLEATRPTS